MEQHIEPGASRNLHPAPSPHILTHDANGHLHHQYYQDPNHERHSLATPQTPSQHQSPRFSTLSPAHARQIYQQPSSYIPQDRSLPDRNITDDNIDDAYVAFILYCNPSFPLSVDTKELRKVFRTPPKSDGNSFSIFTLYELIKRYEAKEIKTWTELALLLGVEKPSVEKGQSSQKVQQYSVRLKVSPESFLTVLEELCIIVLVIAILYPISCCAPASASASGPPNHSTISHPSRVSTECHWHGWLLPDSIFTTFTLST
jgi:hypothetical protein